MTDFDAVSLQARADEVCAALQDYVAALGRGLEPDNVVPAMVVVEEAVAKFVALSVDETGWGNPFALSSPFDDEYGEDAATDDAATDDAADTVEVMLNYSVRCVDRQLARHVVDERLQEAGISDIPEDQIATINGILMTLHSIDGWDPERYQAFSKRPFEVLASSGAYL